MGVFKRYRDALAAQKEAENAVPGAYQSNYTDRIGQTLDALGAGADSAMDVGTDSALYRQYRENAAGNARAAAENAAAGAAALSGGYGSSYANSVAQQGYQQAMANVDDGLAGLREKALTEYQVKQSGLAQLFSSLLSQDSIAAAEHQTKVANAQSWRDYKQSRAAQVAQEKQNFWNNLLQGAENVVNAGFSAYDAYKGYDMKKRALDLQDRQLAAQEEANKWNGIAQGWDYKQNGWSDEALDQYLAQWGVNNSVYDGWSTGSGDAGISIDQYIKLANAASSLIADGQVRAAQELYSTAGLDPSVLNTVIPTTAGYSSYGSGRSGSRSSSGSSGSSGTQKKSSFTNSQLQSMAKEYKSMKPTDELYDFYKQVLEDAGWIKADNLLETGNTVKSGSGQLLTWNDPQEQMKKKYGTVTTGKTTGSTQSKGVDRAVMLAKNYAKKGYSSWAIINNMSANGYSDDEIARALKEAGVTD